MEHGQPLVDLLLRVRPILGEAAVAQVASTTSACASPGSSRAGRPEERAQHLRSRGSARRPARAARTRRRVAARSATSMVRHRTMPRMLPDGRRLGAHLPLGAGHGQGRRAGPRDRRDRAPGLRRQPDRLAPARRAADRAAGVPRAARRARHRPGRDPRRVPGQPRRPRAAASTSGPSSVLAQRAAGGPGVRRPLRERPHRLASRHLASRPASSAAGGRRRRGSSREADDGAATAAPTRARELGRRRLRPRRDLDELPRSPRRSPRAASPSARIGFCLDTAHAWGAGDRPVRARDASTRFLAEFDARDRARAARDGPSQRLEVGARLPHRPPRAPRGGADRRARPGGHLLTHPGLAHATYYLETPGMDEGYDAINVARAYDLAAGRPLAPLPPEAIDAPRQPGPVGPGRARARRAVRLTRDAVGASAAASRRRSAVDLAVLLGLLASSPRACACPDLATRGTWDADQGHDMLVLRALRARRRRSRCSARRRRSATSITARPTTSCSPRPRRSTGGDSPLAVVFEIALFGIAAVGVTWWLARSIGGPVAGLVAGLADGGLGLRDRGIDLHLEPEPHRPHERDRAGRPRGGPGRPAAPAGGCWPPSATAATMQCHVLGVDAPAGRRRAARRGCASARAGRRASGRPASAGLAGLAIVAASYVPLVDPRADRPTSASCTRRSTTSPAAASPRRWGRSAACWSWRSASSRGR